ncbi:MAG: amino acid permease [Neisseriaceae bacterium]|nr:amino acid permease [Neisseriaceae bacterium]
MEQANKDGGSGKKLGVVALTALVVGGIIGSGIFSLPQNMAEGAGAGAIIIAWVITFFGMLSLAKIFEWLSTHRQDIDDGVYGYARHGFGDYLGFNAAWGYWMSVWVGNAGYLVVLFSALGSFTLFQFFGDGTTTPAFIGQVVVLWLVHFFVLKGVRSAALVNTVITIAKVVPIVLFIVCVALAFKVDVFTADFWGTPALGGVMAQVKSTMLFTVWVFLGIESATVYATRAENPSVVSRATLYGFFITVILMACVSILSLGIVPQHELAQMRNPSMAMVMSAALGPWGAALINMGLVISVAGALLAWTLLASEMLYLSGRGPQHTAPAIFGRVNRAQTPAPAMWLTNGLITLLLIYNFYNASGYNKIIQLASSMCLIPYWLCSAFALKEAFKGQGNKVMALLFAAVSTIYSTWLIYAGGLQFVLLSMILYAPGLLFFLKACHEKKVAPFPTWPAKLAAISIVCLGALAIYWVAIDKLTF